ncbi:MAG: DUF6458 family protein [Solirubrobacterales bacterium]
MTIGAGIFLIAVGAILKFATNFHVAHVDIDTVGVILMIAGAVGLVLGFLWEVSRRRGADEVRIRERRDRRRISGGSVGWAGVGGVAERWAAVRGGCSRSELRGRPKGRSPAPSRVGASGERRGCVASAELAALPLRRNARGCLLRRYATQEATPRGGSRAGCRFGPRPGARRKCHSPFKVNQLSKEEGVWPPP